MIGAPPFFADSLHVTWTEVGARSINVTSSGAAGTGRMERRNKRIGRGRGWGKREGVDEGVKELRSTAKVQRGGSSERWRGGVQCVEVDPIL